MVGARDKRTRGRRNMRGRQDNVVIIIIIVWSSPALSVQSVYASCRPVNSSSPTLSRLAEAKYRMAFCTTTGTRPSLFLAMFPPSPPSLSPTTLLPINLAVLALFFAIIAVARLPPSSPLPSPLPPSLLLHPYPLLGGPLVKYLSSSPFFPFFSFFV